MDKNIYENKLGHQPIRAIITGATGMVGEGVLNTCLENSDVEAVLVVSRRPTGISHPKLKEIIHQDFFDCSGIAGQLDGYNACFFCLGVTSLGKTEAAYHKLTYELTLQFAKTLCLINKNMTFCYISGKGTDRSAKSAIMWSRVKGITERDLDRLPFSKVFCFRPSIIIPTPGNRHTLKIYHYFSWLFPLLSKCFPASFCTLKELSQAMVNAVNLPIDRAIYEVADIHEAATPDH
ncbi:Rossmann-fold NAD(P)-binding domain-containing protein [Arachidicoccus rhizosphaerae]|nr:epimerase [Arachidicoccus rhizosphaerae]